MVGKSVDDIFLLNMCKVAKRVGNTYAGTEPVLSQRSSLHFSQNKSLITLV